MYFNRKLLFLTLLACAVINSTYSAPAFARSNDDDDEKQFTEVKTIDADATQTSSSKNYDDALLIKEINFEGNYLVPSDLLLNSISLKIGSRYDKDNIQQALGELFQTGYFTQNMKAFPKPTPTGIILTIALEENIPVTGFTVEGNKVVSSAEILKILQKEEGLPQSIIELNNALKDVESYYADKGYILAKVIKVTDDPDGMINVKINEGVIKDINITGNVKTRDYVIKRNITVAPGEVYNENRLRQDIARLYGTQYFLSSEKNGVRRVISASPDDPDKYNVTIEVEENRTGSISVGGGIDTETGVFGSLGYADNNFRGLGQELNTNFMIGSGVVFSDNDVIRKAPLQFEINFVEPRLKQTLNSLRLTAFARDIASYQVPLAIEQRIGGEVELARPVKKIPNLGSSVSLGIERVKLKEGDEEEIIQKFTEAGKDSTFRIAERAEELRGGTYFNITPGLVYDTRNSLINPTEGWYAGANFNQAIKLTGDANSYGKVMGSAKRYYPVGDKSAFVVGAKIGTRTFNTLPEFASFRLGGPYSVRGFREGDIGNGQGFMMATTEFRTPIPYFDRIKYKFIRDIRFAAFMDAGKLFHKNYTTDLYNRPASGISVGGGLLVPIPMLGPIRFDYGYPISHIASGKKRGQFTFAVGERY